MSKLFKCPPTDLRGHHPVHRHEVQYAVGYTYNGGVGVGPNDEWFDGYEVPPPLLSPGYGLVGIGVGLELNARPPLATAVIKSLSEIAVGTRYMDISGNWVVKQ